jgi:hypothetical protein
MYLLLAFVKKGPCMPSSSFEHGSYLSTKPAVNRLFLLIFVMECVLRMKTICILAVKLQYNKQ